MRRYSYLVLLLAILVIGCDDSGELGPDLSGYYVGTSMDQEVTVRIYDRNKNQYKIRATLVTLEYEGEFDSEGTINIAAKLYHVEHGYEIDLSMHMVDNYILGRFMHRNGVKLFRQ